MVHKKNNPDSVILELILLRTRLYARRRIAWLRKLWSEEGETAGQIAVTHAEIDAILDYRDSPFAEYSWYAENDQMMSLNAEIAAVESKMAKDKNSRYSQLFKTFNLSPPESDILQLCLAIRLDPSLTRLYAYLQDHAGRGFATDELAARLFGYGHSGIWKKNSSLALWKIVVEKEGTSGEPSILSCDPFIVHWVIGEEVSDASLSGVASFVPVVKPLENWPVKKIIDFIKRIGKDQALPIRITITGPPGSGRHSFAAVVCSHFKMKLLAIDSDRIDDWPHTFLCAQRQALLDHCGIAWYGEKLTELPWPRLPLGSGLQFLICDPGQKLKAVLEMIETHIEIPDQPLSGQLRLIKKHIPASTGWERQKFDTLVSQRRLSIGDIIAMKERQVLTPKEATETIRESGRNKLGSLAQLLECPFGWDDLIVPAFLKDLLEDFEFEARERKLFWEQEKARRLFPQGRGLIGLFTGSPGTGKTMAAQVIAANLELDLFRIDLSSVVSKYVGETSQNLERILSRAEHMDIVLLFDEADALFGKRTEVKDAHDRFANTDTNYLLQAIENYRGIAILASNKKENIDTAFIRRLRYVLEFPKPDARQRELIWLKILNKLLPDDNRQILNGQLKTLADNVELTGSQIKFAILSALFAAKREKKLPEMKHLIRGMERELMKEGRALSQREREKLLANAG
jgi:hypothetical protein